jgi:hypothetical protein
LIVKRPFVYICSPYRGNTTANEHKAREYCRKAYDAGYLPLAPHLLFPQFLDESVPEERENGLEMAKALLRRCRSIAICGDTITEGMMEEIMLANRLNMPVLSIDETLVMRQMGKTPWQGSPRH